MTDLRIGLLMLALTLCVLLLLVGPSVAVAHFLPLLAKHLHDLTAGEALVILLAAGILFKD
jgi:hypothetical protein